MNNPTKPKLNFMPVPNTCKFEEMLIKTKVLYGPDNVRCVLIYLSTQRFMPVLDICEFKEVPVKRATAIARTTFPQL